MDPSRVDPFLKTWSSLHGDTTPEFSVVHTTTTADGASGSGGSTQVGDIEYLTPQDGVALVSSLPRDAGAVVEATSQSLCVRLSQRPTVGPKDEQRAVPFPRTHSGYDIAPHDKAHDGELSSVETLSRASDTRFNAQLSGIFHTHLTPFSVPVLHAGWNAVVAMGVPPEKLSLRLSHTTRKIGFPRDACCWYCVHAPATVPLGCLVPSDALPGFYACGSATWKIAGGHFSSSSIDSCLFLTPMSLDACAAKDPRGGASRKRARGDDS